jgi:acyl-CoA synthetase (NDP forming)
MSYDIAAVRKLLDQVRATNRKSLNAAEAKILCDAVGIPLPKEAIATSPADAQRLATEMGFPVVLKIVSPEILHKTEAGGVIVGIKTAAEAAQAYEKIIANAKVYRPGAKIDGVQVQQMLAGGHEVPIRASARSSPSAWAGFWSRC